MKMSQKSEKFLLGFIIFHSELHFKTFCLENWHNYLESDKKKPLTN